LEYFTLCVHNDPYKKDAYMAIAKVYTDLNKFSNAIENCEKALRIDPRYTVALQSLGTLHYHREDYSRSMYYFMRALKYNRETRTGTHLKKKKEAVFEQIQIQQQQQQRSSDKFDKQSISVSNNQYKFC
jgi:tetratricopeptide (TPR) repeat protein